MLALQHTELCVIGKARALAIPTITGTECAYCKQLLRVEATIHDSSSKRATLLRSGVNMMDLINTLYDKLRLITR